MKLSRTIPSEEALGAFAGKFMRAMAGPLVVYLEGPLGAGKTTFVRALTRALGYAGRVKSPTYGLLERYEINDISLVHLDLYRVAEEGELEFLALRDLFDQHTILLIEWPQKGGREIPPPDIRIQFSDSITERELTATAFTPVGGTTALVRFRIVRYLVSRISLYLAVF